MILYLSHWANSASAMVAAYPGAALALVFAAAIIEAVAVVGVLIPGTPILMAITGTAAMAGQPMLPFLVLAFVGAVAGDFLSFWIGRRYGQLLYAAWPSSRRPALLEGASRFFRRYGGYSVALCRFVPVLRSTVPLVAGMAGMEMRRFLAANVASAFLWAPAHIVPAAMAGVSIDLLRHGAWQAGLICAFVMTACIAMGWTLHRRIARSRL
jgi:membrane protein DedA with SNARE-associated domain